MANDNDIAVVGMACRLPGARSVRDYWRNLRGGVESVVRFSEQELIESGVRKEVLRRPNYIPSGAPLEKMEYFDAEFFGFSPKEAAIMDPQHRQFLECAWEALEDAGHMPEAFSGAIGVFAGCGMGSYFMFNLLSNPELVRSVGLFLLRHTGNDKDFLATRLSYLLNLRGPSVNVQTACSTSLVAVHLATQHLLSGECDMALAGGVTIEIPHRRGYHYEEGEILSPDGHCRAFDHRSQGTIFGSGTGVVVLRRLADAIDDGDVIHAVIKGTAVNNDGSQKVGYLAPSVDGQATCIAEALAVADVEPETISYIECHGTGTPMGDPIEVSALTQAFRATTQKVGFCGIGSVKTNIGHLDTAAGVASFIKASLALQHAELPPSLNWEKNNPQLEIETSPFYVNSQLQPWKKGKTPRRAGINSLGVGGTNAFAILEEAPPRKPSAASSRRVHLFALSARNRSALDENARNLARHLREHPEQELADVAWTLQVGRRAFAERRVVAARDREQAIALLESNDPKRVFSHTASPERQSVAFLFPGGGAQYPRMALDLYTHEPRFKAVMDEGLEKLRTKHSLDLKPLLFCAPEAIAEAAKAMESPSVQLPAIFLVEYALAELYRSKGVVPTALLGHSLGENTAACVAGTMSFDACLGLVVLRGQLMDKVSGGMLSVAMPAEELKPLLDEVDLDLATVNAPEMSVASGTPEKLAVLEERLRARGVECQRVRIHIAAHSRLLDPVLPDFERYLRSIELRPPQLPWVSNITGQWITAEQATDPMYWVRHVRSTVRYADGVKLLAEDAGRLFLEVGPGKTLSSLAKMHPAVRSTQASIASLRHPDDAIDDGELFTATLGRLWAAGGTLDLQRQFGDEKRRRVSLPTYAFQSQRFFIDPGKGRSDDAAEAGALLEKEPDREKWFFEPVWKRRDVEEPSDGVEAPKTWLVFVDDTGVGQRLVERLERAGETVLRVRIGDAYRGLPDGSFLLAPEQGRAGYESLVHDLVASGRVPDRVVHLWLLADEERFRPGSTFLHRNLELGLYSLLFFGQAWGAESLKRSLHVTVASSGMHAVDPEYADERVIYPEQAAILGPALVIPREVPGVTVSVVDVDVRALMRAKSRRERVAEFLGNLEDSPLGGAIETVRTQAPPAIGSLLSLGDTRSPLDVIAEELDHEARAPAQTALVAHRRGRRWVAELRRAPAPPVAELPLRERGVVLVTGGLGGISLAIARELAARRRARLVLLQRTALPERAEWPEVRAKLGPEHATTRRIAAVESLEALGAEVVPMAVDVTDVDRMREVIAHLRERFGDVHGVIHAAGVVKDGLLAQKSPTEVEEVLSPKVYGTFILDEVTRDCDLDLFVVFSSTSVVLSPAGQVDYVAANAFLNAFAHARRGRGAKGKTVALGWGVWNEVGMAAEAASRMLGQDAGKSEPASHPWFTRRSVDDRGGATILARYDAQKEWVLDEHRTRDGEALWPGAGYLELCRAALSEASWVLGFSVRDLTFFRPFQFPDGESREARFRLKPSAQGYLFEAQERVVLDGATGEGGKGAQRTGWRKVAQANLWLQDEPTPPLDLAAIEARCTEPMATRSKQEDHLRFGPRWKVVKRASRSRTEAVAELELDPRFAGDLDAIGLHPALVDLGTGFAMDLIEGYTGSTLWVPVSYRAAHVRGALPARLKSVVRLRPGSSEATGYAYFDVSLVDPTGKVLVEVEELTIKRLEGRLDLSPKRIAPSDVELDPEPRQERQLSPAELAFRHNLAQGILPDEGAEAFVRVLSSWARPQVYVSSLDLFGLVRQSEAASREATKTESGDDGARFSRPDMGVDYEAPSDDVEKTLVEIWEDLLGVNRIGVKDSFFDLGGHSLIAVRLFAKVKKSFGVEFPISVLFEAPTIAGAAALIRSARPEIAAAGQAGATAPAEAPASRPRFKHLVAMHPGEGGPRTPFFLVAGMFGNVLNLRHLANQIGRDRPFYGLQARGLYGGDAPHEDFAEMARDYVAEIRRVQPHGPYLLGGFSGGGITALEIAQQLKATGEEVPLLVMLDTPLPSSEPLTTRDKLEMHRQNLERKRVRYFTEWAQNRVEWELKKWRDRRFDAAQQGTDGEFHSKAIEQAFYRALSRYDLKHYAGTISLFRPKLVATHVFGPNRQINKDKRFIFHDNGWTPHCDHVDVYEVPGDHDSMVLEPNVRVVVARIRACILEAKRQMKGAILMASGQPRVSS